MQNLRKLLMVILFPVMSVMAPGILAQEPAATFKEIRPAQPTRSSDKVEVLEVFFYGCIHCYNLEPFVKQWLENMPEDVEFYRMPVIFRDD